MVKPKMETAELKDKETGKVEKVRFKEGALHRQLGYSGEKSLNAVMRKIKKSEIGDVVMLPAPVSKKMKITKLLKKRAVFGLSLQGK